MPDPTQPQCTLVESSARYEGPELIALQFDGADLLIDVEAKNGAAAKVLFREAIGFRVLDERDLLEFWNAYSQPEGWLWRVLSGGWLDLERTRSTFDSVEWYVDAHEYLLVGDTCVSIIANHPPELVDASHRG